MTIIWALGFLEPLTVSEVWPCLTCEGMLQQKDQDNHHKTCGTFSMAVSVLHFYFLVDICLTIFTRHQPREKNIVAPLFTLLQIWGAFFRMISSLLSLITNQFHFRPGPTNIIVSVFPSKCPEVIKVAPAPFSLERRCHEAGVAFNKIDWISISEIFHILSY